MENPTTIKFKRWEDLDITDDFIFSRVMHDENICRQVVELILGVRIGKISYLSAQDEHKTDPDAMRIIMDVYLKDENKVINVEMQASNHGDLPRRARYYQAAADIDTTPKGSEYSDLKQNYVIFICTFDPFHKGKPFYTFQNYCINYESPIPLEDGTEKIFLNTTAKDTTSLDGDLCLFYDYVRGRTAQTAFTKELDNSISRLKKEQEERNMYLTYTSRMMECRRDGYEEGLFTGREEGISIGLECGLEQGLERGAYENKLETARKLITRGYAPEDIADVSGLTLSQVQELLDS